MSLFFVPILILCWLFILLYPIVSYIFVYPHINIIGKLSYQASNIPVIVFVTPQPPVTKTTQLVFIILVYPIALYTHAYSC